MAEKLSEFDPAAMLRNDEAIEIFLADAFETGDYSHIAAAIGAAARAKGMSKIARETGLAREQLYKSLSATGNPTLETLMAVLKAIGVRDYREAAGGLRARHRFRQPYKPLIIFWIGS